MKKFFLLFGFGLLVPFFFASAHQPNYVGASTSTTDYEPEISKAYYGELHGTPAQYQIVANKDIDLYVGILSPRIAGARKDFLVSIYDNNKTEIARLNPASSTWNLWHEEFGGDWYFRGPDVTVPIKSGVYTLRVENKENTGAYSLAIGSQESFPAGKFPHFLKELFLVKIKSFQEPWYSIFYGIIGKYLAVTFCLIILVLLTFIYFLFKKLKKIKSA